MKRRIFLGSLGALFLPTVAVAKTIVENKITSPTEEEDFYQFYLNFNSFSTPHHEKVIFNWRKMVVDMKNTPNNHHTEFLLTLAVWESMRGKKVALCVDTDKKIQILKKVWSEKSSHINDNCKFREIDLITPNDIWHTFISSKKYDIYLHDREDDRNLEWFKEFSTAENIEYRLSILKTHN